MKYIIIIVLAGFVSILFKYRYSMPAFIVTHGPIVAHKEGIAIGSNAQWFDDYYTVEYIDDRTIAIGEPRYYQQNFNYLIIGDDKAILFDLGPGVRNIQPVVESLTSLPIITMVSHYHYDHIGNIEKSDNIYLAENQIENQELSEDQTIKPTERSFVGKLEGKERKEFKASKILKSGDTIDLGNRIIQIIPLPGHAHNSIGLYDDDTKQLFTGDFIIRGTNGTISKMMPDANLAHYKASMSRLLEIIDPSSKVYGGHTNDYSVPILTYDEIEDIFEFLCRDDVKEGLLPKVKTINEKVKFIY